MLTVLVGYGIIGFVDDYRKVVRKDTKGLIARWKYFWMSVIALGVAFALYSGRKRHPGYRAGGAVLQRRDAAAGAVLHFAGLLCDRRYRQRRQPDRWSGWPAIMPTVFVAGGFALVARATGNMNFANYLHIPYLRHAGNW